MKVKNRLSLQFTLMFGGLLLLVLPGIYWFEEENRSKTFFDKLDDRAINVAQFYLAEDNLSTENFKQVLKKFPESLTKESIRIYNENGQPKFIPQGSVRWGERILKRVARFKNVHFSEGDTQVAGIYYPDNSGNFIIMVSAVDEGGYAAMHELGIIILSFFFGALGITFFCGRIFAEISLLPIVRITKNLKQIRATSLDLRLPVNNTKADEIDILSLTINNLLEHLEQSFENQRAFISNASHELRTPITSILGDAETTLMKNREMEEYTNTLKAIIKDAERLRIIINSLMELVQTNLDTKDFQSIRMDELLWEAVDEVSARNKKHHIKLQYNLPPDKSKFTLQGNQQLLFIAISNILKNAVKFSGDKEVECEIFCDQQGVNIIITDHGIGINNADLSRIFQPFFRSVNALEYPGNGIGLSLTQNILRLHNAKVLVKSRLDHGSEFHLIFPVI